MLGKTIENSSWLGAGCKMVEAHDYTILSFQCPLSEISDLRSPISDFHKKLTTES